MPFYIDVIPTSGGGGGSFATQALDNLSSVAINTSLLPNGNNTLDLGSSSKNWETLFVKTGLRLQQTAAGTNDITIQAPSTLAASYTLTLPVDDGNPNQLLQTNGSGVLTWIDTPNSAVWGLITGTLSDQTDLQNALDAKKTIATGNNYKFETTGATGHLQETTVTGNRAVATDVNGLPTASATTDTELSYVSGVTSAIQTQLNGKQATLTIGNLTDVGTDGITIGSGTGAVIGTGTTISQHVADTTHNGYLNSTDWNTFNGKQNALTFGNLTDAGTDGITITGGTGAVIGSGTSISQHVADTSHNGYLTSTDWNTFNNKVPTGSITTSGLTQNTARLLGRTTATAGAIEEITVGTGLSLSAGSLTNSGVTSITGTANQIIASASTGAITLSTPQDIGTGSSPTFSALTLTNALTVANGGTGDQSFTAYAPIAGGTTTTGALQSLSSGMATSGFVLTSNGTSAAPTWQAAGSSGANTALSNLASVAINTSLLPGTDNAIDLGSQSKQWRNLYFAQQSSVPTTPSIAWWDNTHSAYVGIYGAGTGGGIRFFQSGKTFDDCFIYDNGSSPALYAGRTDFFKASVMTFYEATGLQGIADSCVVNGSNCGFSITAKPNGSEPQPEYGIAQSTVQTTDNTTTAIDARILGANTSVLFEFRVTGRRTGGSAGTADDSIYCIIRGMYANKSGTATLVGTLFKEINKDNTNCDVTISLATNVVTLNVKGATNNNYNWTNTVIMQKAI